MSTAPAGVSSRADHFPAETNAWSQDNRGGMLLSRSVEEVPDVVMDRLRRHAWPRNVRDLQDVIERAVIVAARDTSQIPRGSPRPQSHFARSHAREVETSRRLRSIA